MFFFFFFLKTRNSIAVVPLGMSGQVSVKARDSTPNFHVNPSTTRVPMISSHSHTLEYKPNDIIIASSIGDVLLHHPKYLYVISLPGSTSEKLGGGASVLILTLALLRRRTECRLDFHHVTVSRGHMIMVPAPALAWARMHASLSRCVIARAEKGDRSGTLLCPKTLTACNEQISHAFSSRGFILCRLAEPRPRIRECLTPRVYVASQSNAISHVA